MSVCLIGSSELFKLFNLALGLAPGPICLTIFWLTFVPHAVRFTDFERQFFHLVSFGF